MRSIITTDKKPWLDLLLKIKTFFIGTTLFPWWFIICIYLLCHIYIAVATYFLIIYGVKFDTRANSWLQACAVSVVQDLFINSPGGFIARTILLVLVLEFLEAVFFKSKVSVTLLFSRRSTVVDMNVPQMEMESPMPTAQGYNIPDVLVSDETMPPDIDLSVESELERKSA